MHIAVSFAHVLASAQEVPAYETSAHVAAWVWTFYVQFSASAAG